MARRARGYKSEKRKKELKRQKKQEEKRLKRQNRSESHYVENEENLSGAEQTEVSDERQADIE